MDEQAQRGGPGPTRRQGGHRHHERHGGPTASTRPLWWALAVSVALMAVEVAGGLIANSVALLADAGHMVTDVLALGLAIVVARLATTEPTGRRTFGLLRAEVIGAFVNGGTLVLVVGWIFWEAARRLGGPQHIQAPLMLTIAVAGLLANLAAAAILSGGRRHSLNVEGAFLHVAGDALGSVGVVVAALVIWLTGWTPVDIVVSVAIGAIILWSSLRLVWQTLHILLHLTPRDIDFARVKAALEHNPHVDEVYDLHIWTLATGIPVLSAHVRLREECDDSRHWHQCLAWAQTMLRDDFGIVHSTLQMEPQAHEKDERMI